MPQNAIFGEALNIFSNHYQERLGSVEIDVDEEFDIKHSMVIKSPLLRKGNYPKIWHHGERTKDVIVLTHGLTDSPYYMQAIGRRFLNEGLNVVLPLLPAHGLIDPDEAMEDYKLDTKWKEEIDNAVNIAEKLGERISLGGFSTGAALSLNRLLRDPQKIKGGLFLFSGALDLGLLQDISRIDFIQSITKVTDGKIRGVGRNPYKYPEMPSFAGIELTQIIRENLDLYKGKVIHQGVFAAHSLHDTTVKIEGLLEFLKENVKSGVAFVISENVSHSNLVLDKDIELDDIPGSKEEEKPLANPKFEWMLDDAIRFFREHVIKDSAVT